MNTQQTTLETIANEASLLEVLNAVPVSEEESEAAPIVTSEEITLDLESASNDFVDAFASIIDKLKETVDHTDDFFEKKKAANEELSEQELLAFENNAIVKINLNELDTNTTYLDFLSNLPSNLIDILSDNALLLKRIERVRHFTRKERIDKLDLNGCLDLINKLDNVKYKKVYKTFLGSVIELMLTKKDFAIKHKLYLQLTIHALKTSIVTGRKLAVIVAIENRLNLK